MLNILPRRIRIPPIFWGRIRPQNLTESATQSLGGMTIEKSLIRDFQFF
jgi:hypothetical protein